MSLNAIYCPDMQRKLFVSFHLFHAIKLLAPTLYAEVNTRVDLDFCSY